MDIREGEIQTAILIPKDSYENTHGCYIKYAMHNAMDIATLGTSVNVRLSADKKTVERARVAFGVAGPVPLRAATAEDPGRRTDSLGGPGGAVRPGRERGHQSPGLLARRQGLPDAHRRGERQTGLYRSGETGGR